MARSIFIGYTASYNTFRFLDLETFKVYVTADARFLETSASSSEKKIIDENVEINHESPHLQLGRYVDSLFAVIQQE